MGEERVVPSPFRRIHPTRRTPIVAIVFTTVVAMILISTWVPIAGMVVCIGLLTQREAEIFLRSGGLLLLGLLLWVVNTAATRREAAQ
jgi:basic amino acid/polyamine antiporter, APA family